MEITGQGRTRWPIPQHPCFQPSRSERRYPTTQTQHPQGSMGRKPGGVTRNPTSFPSWQHLLHSSRMKYEGAAGTGSAFSFPAVGFGFLPTQNISIACFPPLVGYPLKITTARYFLFNSTLRSWVGTRSFAIQMWRFSPSCPSSLPEPQCTRTDAQLDAPGGAASPGHPRGPRFGGIKHPVGAPDAATAADGREGTSQRVTCHLGLRAIRWNLKVIWFPE